MPGALLYRCRRLLNVFIVLLTLGLPLCDAYGRAGGGQNYPGSSGGSGTNGRGGSGAGGGWEALPGVLGAIGAIAFLIYLDPTLGLSVLAGMILVLYLSTKVQNWFDRSRRRMRKQEENYFKAPDWSHYKTAEKELPIYDPVVVAAVSIMIADGKIEENEYALVLDLAHRRHINTEKLTALLNSVDPGKVPSFSRRERREANMALWHLEKIARSDGSMDRAEIELLKKIQRRLVS